MKTSKLVKRVLFKQIKKLEKEKEIHVKNPKKDFTRKRKLDFRTVTHTILAMGTRAVKDELHEIFNYRVETPTTSAFVQQRDKLKPSAFESLFYSFSDAFPSHKRYKGYRLKAVDGSVLPIFPNPKVLENYNKKKTQSIGCSQLCLNVTYDLLARRYDDAVIQPGNHKDEHKAFRTIVKRYRHEGKTIFIGDRLYESYNNFAQVADTGHSYLFRVKDKESNGILSGLQLPEEKEFDIDIERILTRSQTNQVKANPHIYKIMAKNTKFDFLDDNNEYRIKFRIVRFKTEDGTHQAIITNLCREEFEAEEVKELYKMRWGIETSFRKIKYAVGMNAFHSKKVTSIHQEIYARLILHNFCEIIADSVVVKKSKTKYGYQLNFTRSVRVCLQFLRRNKVSRLIDVEALIEKELSSIRPDRKNNSSRNGKKRIGYISFNYRF